MIRGYIVRDSKDRREWRPNAVQAAVCSLGFPSDAELVRLGEPMTEAERAWVEANYRLIRAMVWKSRRVRRWARNSADGAGFAVPCVVRALRNWRLDGGAKLSTLVAKYVLCGISPSRVISASGWWPGYSPHGRVPLLLSAADVAVPADEPDDMTELLDAVAVAFAGLRKRERRIVSLYLGLDGPAMTLREMAVRYKITAERVRQIAGRALNKMGQRIGFPRAGLSSYRSFGGDKRRQRAAKLS